MPRGIYYEDAQQVAVVSQLQDIFAALQLSIKSVRAVLHFWRKPELISGLSMGRCRHWQTILMDCFYECNSFYSKKMRTHFHQFMKFIHQELKRQQGKIDPVQIIAKELAQKTSYCVSMNYSLQILRMQCCWGDCLKPYFRRVFVLVATSNVIPDDLYKRGLQREQFLPAIALLKQHKTVLHMASQTDYRLRHLKNAGVFYSPNDFAAQHKMEKTFSVLTNGENVCDKPIEICGRPVNIKMQAGDVVWFDFNVICRVPRSQHDYLAIAEKYKTVFISDVPVIPPNAKDMISLFIRLVDVFYDARVRLVLSSAELVGKNL